MDIFDTTVNQLLAEVTQDERVNVDGDTFYHEYVVVSPGRRIKRLHRVDGPAVIKKNGSKEWHQQGKLHRIDGPAVETLEGRKEWWVDGERHRLDGPAYENEYGHKEWYINGERHREDGPAVVYGTGKKDYYIHGNYMTEEEYNEYQKKKKVKQEIESHKNNRIDPGMLEDYL